MAANDLGPAGSLVAAIVQANSDSLAWTNERIRSNLEAQLTSLAQAYVDLYEHVDRERYMSRRLHTYLDMVAVTSLPNAERLATRQDD